jgi:hypothetical protein
MASVVGPRGLSGGCVCCVRRRHRTSSHWSPWRPRPGFVGTTRTERKRFAGEVCVGQRTRWTQSRILAPVLERCGLGLTVLIPHPCGVCVGFMDLSLCQADEERERISKFFWGVRSPVALPNIVCTQGVQSGGQFPIASLCTNTAEFPFYEAYVTFKASMDEALVCGQAFFRA